MDATAEAILDGLDDAQRMAATAVRGPVRIIAGAGAGKTRTVTRRIAYACAIKAWDPHATLAVTFSVKAAAEMRNRLSQLDVASDVKAATFHSRGTTPTPSDLARRMRMAQAVHLIASARNR